MVNIILASASPRRKEILDKFNFKYHVMKSDILEKTNPLDGPYDTAMSLAFEKAYYIGKNYENHIIIGADTIVVLGDEILGKPRDKDDARRILQLLSGKKHRVITGIALINLKNMIKIVDYEETFVKFRNLDGEIINRYIDTDEPFDKAGAYGIQGYGGLLVEKINGCYDNVIGLPVGKLNQLLKKHFDINIL